MQVHDAHMQAIVCSISGKVADQFHYTVQGKRMVGCKAGAAYGHPLVLNLGDAGDFGVRTLAPI